MMKLIPFGYAAPGAEKRLQELMRDEKAYLIDIRYRPRSHRPEWHMLALQKRFGGRYGDRYQWRGGHLGNANYNNDGPIQIANPEKGIAYLVLGLKKGYTIILLCACKDYERCHRKTVVELVKAELPEVEIVL